MYLTLTFLAASAVRLPKKSFAAATRQKKGSLAKASYAQAYPPRGGVPSRWPDNPTAQGIDFLLFINLKQNKELNIINQKYSQNKYLHISTLSYLKLTLEL